MRKFIYTTFFTLFSLPLYANNTNELDNFLNNQDYYRFELNFQQLNTSQERKDYLFKHIYSGHAIVYWLLANEFSQDIMASKYVVQDKSQIDFTKRMIYTALLITEQDAAVCMDRKSLNAARSILYRFPQITDFERRYFINNIESMNKSVEFVENLKNRQEPKWVCLQYGDKMNYSIYGKTYNKSEFATLRAAATTKIVNTLNK